MSSELDVELEGVEFEKPEEDEAYVKGTDLFSLLEKSFTPPAYITLREVRDATGFDGVRSADAMAISLYRSRGKSLWGFEFKVSRNDWLKELKQPEKSESILRFCDYWALVVSDKNIVKDGELPETWGLYVAQKSRLKCVKPCPKLEPQAMDRTMLTALAYAIDHKHKKSNERELTKAKNEGYEQGVKSSHLGWYKDHYDKLDKIIKEFEQASGLNIQYGAKDVPTLGGIVKEILSGERNLTKMLRDIQYSIRSNKGFTENLEKQAAEIEAMIQRNGDAQWTSQFTTTSAT